MKRRTTRTGTINGHHHRKAFDHACLMLKSQHGKRCYQRQKTHARNGLRIRFCAELECEDGTTLTFEFTCTRGFRVSSVGTFSTSWAMAIPKNPDQIRCHKGRLRAYREKLHCWRSISSIPLTFRSFNLLLAALSYDIASTAESVSPHRD